MPELKKAEDSPLKALSVSELTQIIRVVIEDEPLLKGVWVQGEVSNVRVSSAGHLYFTLKDEFSQVECVFFAFASARKVKPVDGTAVLVFGDVRIYEKRSQYQIQIQDILLKGEGLLAQEFEKLKRKLFEEGLFAEEHKLTPPTMPKVVGVVTSSQSAAWRDVLNILGRRAPYLRVVLFEAQVQGESAPPTIISALKRAEKLKEVEVILLVRGGGSLEDLFCFNDESLARTIYKLKKPVIAGIGHEIDFTIADFVADVRAETPSAAAELVAPSITDLADALAGSADELASSVLRSLKQAEYHLSSLGVARFVKDALRRFEAYEENLRELGEKLARQIMLKTSERRKTLTSSVVLIGARRVLGKLKSAVQGLDETSARLAQVTAQSIEERMKRIGNVHEKLSLLDPRDILKRGYALIWDEEMKKVYRRAHEVVPAQRLVAELYDGFIETEAYEVRRKKLSD